MFSLDIVDSDAFLDMPISSQALYFHIGMRSDDDGFCASPSKVIKIIGASNDDLKILIGKKFLLECNNGVILVKHWWIHNTKRKDTYKKSNYLIDNADLRIDENKAYTFNENGVRYLSVNEPLTQDKISKDKIIEVNISKDNLIEDKDNSNKEQNLHPYTLPLLNRLLEAKYCSKGSMEEVSIKNLVINKLLNEGQDPMVLKDKINQFIDLIRSVDLDDIDNKANYLRDYLLDDNDELPF